MKVICIKSFDGDIDFINKYGNETLLHNIYFIKENYIYTINEPSLFYYKFNILDDCVMISGKNDCIDDDFYYYVPKEFFNKHFITIAEFRETRINSILNG